MTTYTGTLTGSGTFTGPGFTEQESQSDAETVVLTIDASGNFTGTDDQLITTTVTVNIPGVPPTTQTSTYDSGPQPVSGNVNTPYTTIQIDNGNSVETIWTFSAGPAYSTITVTGIDTYNSGGIYGTFDFGGTLNLSPPPLSTILTGAQQMFGGGNYNYSYGGDGTSADTAKNGTYGIGIDCSHMVWEALLADGYNLPYLTTNSIMNFYDVNGNFVNTLTATGAKYFTSVSPSLVGPGDIIMFDPRVFKLDPNEPNPGHMGIVADYDPFTGTGHFYGSQGSTGPALTSFSTNGTTPPLWQHL
jgi:hypothetical protein